ncbi:DUF3558 family protein [Saccharothrix variisporea]|uniref:Uncharacterized protein DUF3558 n=1 Tax=Saccharothrix variisporea TaxID=543527 RepID=A0A495XC78_9PSEU|nr:DUF3558 family protein [Saccharothrix variisporea]RKT71860.1 uncharacterized protein DUF3558 [Saccharothrix variisporea]
MQLTRNLVIRSILPIAVLGVVLAGCSEKQGGTPTAGSDTPTTTGTSAKPTTTSSSGTSGGLESFDACAAVQAAAGQLPLTEIEPNGKAGCDAEFGTSVSLGVKAYPSLGISDFVMGPNSKPSDITIGSRKARKVGAPAGGTTSSCAVTIEVTAKSRVDVVASANASQDEACDAATKLATAIEPKLPK